MGRRGDSKGEHRQQQRRRIRKILNKIGDLLTGKVPNFGRRHYGGGLNQKDVHPIDKDGDV